jgi:hypothetical protein
LRIDSVVNAAGMGKSATARRSFVLPQNGGIMSWPPSAAT